MKFLTLIGIVALMWLVGLFVFADRVRSLTPAPEPERADAIVALTGPSAERVNAAIRLLDQDKGDRLLISGVNKEVRRQELRALTPGSNRLFNCCVDLGFEAEDTEGNAQEIGAWARSHGYDDLIVVTSDYHMPRSLLEIRSVAPGIRLHAYAVETPSLDNSRWWKAAVTARRMTLEYMKYLAVLGREALHKVTGHHKERETLAAPPADAPEKASEKASEKAA
ncbi:YdcF family protein [soil metagenome]